MDKEVFRKKPLGRRWHLMSSSARSGAANLVSATSGTERERGFVGILLCPREPLISMKNKHKKNISKVFLERKFV